MQVMEEMSIPLPKAFYPTNKFILNPELHNLMEAEEIDLDGLKNLIQEVKRWSIEVDKTTLNFAAVLKVNVLLEKLYEKPKNI